jgi:hypothetical protein
VPKWQRFSDFYFSHKKSKKTNVSMVAKKKFLKLHQVPQNNLKNTKNKPSN